MSEKKYYEQEYNFLHEAGQVFAEQHSRIAGKLKMDGDDHRKDPFVERMLEAFAFLSGRIHERLDDDIPEFAGGLLEQLFPQLLRPFPSCTILQAATSPGAITKPQPIPRGSRIQGRGKIHYEVPISHIGQDRTEMKKEDAEFIFRTTQDFRAFPMKLMKVDTRPTENSPTALFLEIRPNRNVMYETLELDRLTLYLHGSFRQKYTLLLYLAEHATSLAVREIGGKSTEFQKISDFKIGIPELHDAVDDGKNHAILPYARQTFAGYRLLQEYFSFPEKFFFIDILGLDAFKASTEAKPFEIRIEFNKPLAHEFQPTEKNILINCVPAVNLFDVSSDPVVVDRRKPEYYITPRSDRRQSREIYAVTEVVGQDDNKDVNYRYTPVTSYKTWDVNDAEYKYRRFYSLALRPDTEGGMGRAYIRLFGPSLEQETFPRETLSLDTIMSNGVLPASHVDVGKLTDASFGQGVNAKNIIPARETLPCPQRENFLWLLISHLSVSYTSLADNEENLKTILSLYNWSRYTDNANRKKIEQGIVRVRKPEEKTEYRNRSVIRGIEFTIDIDRQKFEQDEGDIYLFYLVLNRFLAEYLTINSFIRLKFVDKETKEEYEWQQLPGKISMI